MRVGGRGYKGGGGGGVSSRRDPRAEQESEFTDAGGGEREAQILLNPHNCDNGALFVISRATL